LDDDENSHLITESDKVIVQRALQGQSIRDEPYTFKHLHELMRQCAGSERHQVYSESEKLAFEHYSRCVMLYMEGKQYAGKQDIGSMARGLAEFESESAPSFQKDPQSHIEFRDIWQLVGRLDSAFPANSRPSIVDLLESLGDQRKPVMGAVGKNEHEVRLARVSCDNLE
jgi:hypothetical protein